MFSIGAEDPEEVTPGERESQDKVYLGRIPRTDTESSMEVMSEKDRKRASLIYSRELSDEEKAAIAAGKKISREMSMESAASASGASAASADEDPGSGMGPKKVSFIAGTSEDGEEAAAGEEEGKVKKKKKKRKNKQ